MGPEDGHRRKQAKASGMALPTRGTNGMPRLSDRTKGSGCPVCGGKQGLPGFNDLATTNPELVSQADGWDPTTVTAGTERKRAWRCDRGHRWEARVSHGAEVLDARSVPTRFYCLGTTSLQPRPTPDWQQRLMGGTRRR